VTAKPPRPDITGKYAAYLSSKGMSCHYPTVWLDRAGGCSHPDHHPLTLDLTRGDVNVIEMALRLVLITESGDEPMRERVKNTLRRVESKAVVKAAS
jgi:hypothetical protein